MTEGTDCNLTGIYSLEDLKTLCREKIWCPYFLSRHLISVANIVVYNYQYMLDPKISNLVSKEIQKDAIVVFDEAHNIDNICIEALSVRIDRRKLQGATQNLHELSKQVNHAEKNDKERLNQEYQALVEGLRAAAGLGYVILFFKKKKYNVICGLSKKTHITYIKQHRH